MNAKAMTTLKDHRVDWSIIVSQQRYIIGWDSRLVKLIRVFKECWRACDLLELCRHRYHCFFGPTSATVDANQDDVARAVLIQGTALPAFRFVKLWKHVNVR